MAFVTNLLFWLTKRTPYNAFAKEFAQTRTTPWDEADIFCAQINSGMNILDAGCGNGRNVQSFENTGAVVTGIDSSRALLQIARENSSTATFVEGKLEALPFSLAQFDGVFAIASLHHLSSQNQRQRGFAEVIRVLKPGGIFGGSVWNLWQERFAENRQKSIRRSQILPWWSTADIVIPWGKDKLPRLYYAFNPESLRAYLQAAGFVEIEIFSVTEGKKADPLAGKNICFLAKKPARKHILDVPFDLVDKQETLQKMHNDATGMEQKVYTTPNPEICVYAYKNPDYRHLLQQADVSVPDGMGILWAAEYLHSSTKSLFVSLFRFGLKKISRFFSEAVCGSDLFREFCESSAKPIFLLGGAKGIAEKCAEYFRKVDGNIVETDSGKANADDDERIVQKVNSSGAKVLFVAFGAPKQEEWIFRNKDKLPHVRVLMGVGGSFDFVAGAQTRAPKLLRTLGLEWLWRLVREPTRFGRIRTAVWTFPRLVKRKSQ